MGPAGSGKTTLAARLARNLDLPAVHLDWHLWSGTRPFPDAEQRRRMPALLADDNWVVEGAYWRVTDLLFEAATVVVVLDVPFLRSFPRYVRRELRGAWRGWTPRTLKEYVKLHNPLFWACYYPLIERRRVLRAARAAQPGAHVIIARTPADAERRIELALKQ
jgi:adenylate kinase family enzyme